MTQNTLQSLTAGILTLMSLVGTFCFIVIMVHFDQLNTKLMELNTSIQHVENRIDLQAGKATLTAGNTCILHQDAMETKELTLQLAEACWRAQQDNL
jgi:hypothetical protein